MADVTAIDDQPHLAAVARGVLLLRLAAAALSLPVLFALTDPGWSFLALLAVLAVSLVPLLTWRRVQPHLTRHPMWLSLDLAVAVVFLSASGVEAPFVIATVATAFLGGLLFGVPGGGVSAGLLLIAYALIATGQSIRGDIDDPVALVVTFGALYPLLALAGAGLRRLLAELDAARLSEAAAIAQVAASEERLRLARDLHDSVGKSLHGIALAAGSLVGADPAVVADRARMIEEGATTAGNEARELMMRLRSPAVDTCLSAVLSDLAQQLAMDTTLQIHTEVAPDVDVPAAAREVLLAAVGEALENVRRHASASTVWLTVAREGKAVVISVVDDGVGFDADRPAEARRTGHWGMVGVQERLEGLGGQAQWQSSPGSGTHLRLVVPDGAPAAPLVQP